MDPDECWDEICSCRKALQDARVTPIPDEEEKQLREELIEGLENYATWLIHGGFVSKFPTIVEGLGDC